VGLYVLCNIGSDFAVVGCIGFFGLPAAAVLNGVHLEIKVYFLWKWMKLSDKQE